MGITYNKKGSAFLIYTKLDVNLKQLWIDEKQKPSEALIDSLKAAFAQQWQLPKDYISVHTFKLTSKKGCTDLENMIKFIDDPMMYGIKIQINDESGMVTGILISEPNPDKELAKLNPETLEWILPNDYDMLRRRMNLEKSIDELKAAIIDLEQKQLRSLMSISAYQLANKVPEKNDVAYFTKYEKEKRALRSQLGNLQLELLTMRQEMTNGGTAKNN